MAKATQVKKNTSALKATGGGLFGQLMARIGPGIRSAMSSLGQFNPERIPPLNRLQPDQRQPALVVALVISALLAAGFLTWNIIQVGNRADYIEISTRLQMLSQRYTKTAQQAVLGNAQAFGQLEEARLGFADGLKTLIDGGATVPASPGAMQADLAALKKRWEISKKDIEALSSQQATLVSLGRALVEINQRNSELLDLTEQVAALLPSDSRKQWSFANQQSLWTQRMAKNANALLSSDVINPETAYQLSQDIRTFRDVLNGLLRGSDALGVTAASDVNARDKLLELQEVF